MMYYIKDKNGDFVKSKSGDYLINMGRLSTHIGIIFMMLIALIMWGCPTYNVWQQGLEGQAELRRAEQNRQVAVEEARAKNESAKHLAMAEISRAEGVAEANRIIADGLGGPEGYLRYLWIERLPNAKAIYIPTETGMPITEASRFGEDSPK